MKPGARSVAPYYLAEIRHDLRQTTVALGWLVCISIEMTRVSAPRVRVISRDPERLQERFQLQKDLILSSPQDVHQHLAIAMINSMPEPPLRFFPLDKRPHFIDFRFLSTSNDHLYLIWVQQGEQTVIHTAERRRFFLSSLMTVVGLIFSTRAVSRMPLPLSAMSTTCSLTSGRYPL